MLSILLWDVIIWPAVSLARERHILYAVAILLCVAAIQISMNVDPTYYDVLGVPFDASTRDVKRAWRTMSKEVHPDKGGNEAAFNDLRHAYEILSDTHKKVLYDRYGPQGIEIEDNVRDTMLISSAVYYSVWAVLVYFHLESEARARGRMWAYTCLGAMGAFEWFARFNTFPYELPFPVFYIIAAAREAFINILFLCRLLSEHSFVDEKQLLRDQLWDIQHTLEDMAKQLKLKPPRLRIPKPPVVETSKAGRWTSLLVLLAIKYALS